MPKYVTYKCDTPACGLEFKHFHATSDEPYPSCPQCHDDVHWVPGSFAITGHKSKAIDIAQQVAEQDFGLTDFKDNTRPGDTIGKGPAPMQSSERDQIVQEVAEFQRAQAAQEPQLTSGVSKEQMGWNWFGAGASVPTAPGAPSLGAQARAEGSDPIALLHEAGKKGKAGITVDVLGSADVSGKEDGRAGKTIAV